LTMGNVSFNGNVFDCEPGMFLGYQAVSAGVSVCMRSEGSAWCMLRRSSRAGVTAIAKHLVVRWE